MDPYSVWISEIMLQQTTVKAVKPYYLAFLDRWPDVEALADAEQEDVLSVWAGLGYYSRARNLHRCAREVVQRFGGVFPEDEEELLSLPGIGVYTAAAIAAIAFGKVATPVDGNIERVVSRLFSVTAPLPGAKPKLRSLAATLTPQERPGDYAQAMMDLGASICSPRRPACLLCPVNAYCSAYEKGLAETLPYREAAREKPTRHGNMFFVLRSDGSVLLRQRPAKGLLGGMIEVPAGPWSEDPDPDENPFDHAPVDANWMCLEGVVRHTFTHFHLELTVYSTMVQANSTLRDEAFPERCRWIKRADLDRQALPSVMRKVITHAFESGLGQKKSA
jgi:A/G-specific adenine glycosylase